MKRPEPASAAILSRLPGGPLVGAEIGVLGVIKEVNRNESQSLAEDML